MNRRKFLTIMVLSCVFSMNAQNKPHFISPFDFPLSLSSNFAELRSNHFHGGLDFKTQGTVGKPIHCVADGYVSRVAVTAGGYGQVIYITHDNGYTSVYGHVMKFADVVEKIVKEYQYKHETFFVDLKFEPHQINFKAGQIIALSGNEGFSFGPHLHFELRKTETNEYCNPLPFYKNQLKDTRAPQATSITVYPKPGKGTVAGSDKRKIVPVAQLATPIEAWGEIGIGIKAFDYMDGTANHYGVYSVTLFVDSKEVFNSTANQFKHDENRMINAFTDFKEFKNHGSWIMRSYRLPGNTLEMVKSDSHKGVIDIDKEKDYHIKYVLEDLHGNKKSYSFVIRGKRQPIHTPDLHYKNILYYNKGNKIQEPGMDFTTSKGMVYDNVYMNSKVISCPNSISDKYQLHDEPVALHAACNLMIGVKHKTIADTSKYYIARIFNNNSKSYVGGKYEKGWVKGDIKELGTYCVEADTISPRVAPLYQNQWASGNIQFKVSDAESGIKAYKVFIDRKFEVFGYSLKNGKLTMKYPKKYPMKGKHQIDVVIEDNCNNITHKVYKF